MVLPYQHIRDLVVRGKAPLIRVGDHDPAVRDDQIQPASLDFRLGRMAFAMKTAALPHGEFVIDLIRQYKKFEFELQPDHSNLLEKDTTYIIPLLESCNLPGHMHIEFSPKSSTGRSDVFVRVLADRWPHYDLVPDGYHGPLYLEVTPLSFDVEVCMGLPLVQGRFKTTKTRRLDNEEIAMLHAKEGLVLNTSGEPLDQSSLRISQGELYYHVDLTRDVAGFVASGTSIETINLSNIDTYEPRDFWEVIPRPRKQQLILVPGKFYLLATKEQIRIPKNVCGQVLSHKITTGEIRPHYAGFFDPGFGHPSGTNGVLEVRSRDVPFRLVDGQPVCAMMFEHLATDPDSVYQGSYVKSGPSIGKHFKHRYEVWNRGYWMNVFDVPAR